jgi:hypothetical protein
MANDRGTGPAPPESPADAANESEEPIKWQPPIRPVFCDAATTGSKDRGSAWVNLNSAEEDEGADAVIEAMFRYRLMGLRRLPRYQRSHALRAAREWRFLELKALRERRARDRHARYMQWRLQLPPPSGSG